MRKLIPLAIFAFVVYFVWRRFGSGIKSSITSLTK